jgi:hypothetical protein
MGECTAISLYNVVIDRDNKEKKEEELPKRSLLPAIVARRQPTRHLREILQKFTAIDKALFPAYQKEKFNRDTFSWKTKAYYHQNKIPSKYKVDNNKLAEESRPTLMIKNVATLNDNWFFKDCDGNYISVRNGGMAHEAQRLGYVEINISHIMTVEQIPKPSLRTAALSVAVDLLTVKLQPKINIPDFSLNKGRLPCVYIRLDKMNPESSENYAVAIVRIWEDRVIWKGNVYSPVKYWTKDGCLAHGLKEPLTRYAKPYVAMKVLHKSIMLKLVTEDSKQLNKEAMQWAKTQKDNGDEWFDLAIKIANNA